jgi:V8-like Glu-specific endopeptidase
MHFSNKQRTMNKTFTILSNKHCSSHNDVEQDQSNCIMENISQLSITPNNNRFCTFTKCKIKQQSTTQDQQRYFDSPTMIIPDDEIPISRCSNKISITEPSLDETELSDLLIFTNRTFKIASI